MPPLVATLYNPHTQTKQELIQNFVVRLKLFKKLSQEIKTARMQDPEQHLLIEGQRGMGKTTLLLRLAYEIENDPDTASRFIPIIFEEEAYYRITRLFQLWEETAKLLAKWDNRFQGLFEQMRVLKNPSSGRRDERQSFEILISALKQHGRKLILLIDNFSELCKQWSEQDTQRLREILMTCAEIRWIGATTGTLEASFRYDRPFYEFFKKYTLEGLNREETQTLLLQLAQSDPQETMIQAVLKHQPGRVETLRILTGGVLRTIVLLFEIFVDEHRGEALRDLEKILDRVTPLYKHRMEDLPILQREVVSALAMNWDGMSLSEIAERIDRPIDEVETALTELKSSFLVELHVVDTQTQWYFLQERFFNIWYLMRSSTGGELRVIWLVRFLEVWYDREQLIDRAKSHINALEKPGYLPKAAYFYTEALAYTGKLGWELESELKKKTKEYLEGCDKSLVGELSPTDVELIDQALNLFKKNEYEQAKSRLLKIKQSNEDIHQLLGTCFLQLGNLAEAERYYLMAIEKGGVYAMEWLAILYHTEFKDYHKAERYYLMAIEKGGVHAMKGLAVLYHTKFKDYPKAEDYYLMAVKKGDVEAMRWLADFYYIEFKDYPKAEDYYLMAVKKGDVEAMYALALLYHNEFDFEYYTKAEYYYLMAIENGHPQALNSIARHFFKKKIHRYTALCCAEHAFEKKPKDHIAHTLACIHIWHHHFTEAIEVAKMFIEKKDFYERHSGDGEVYLMLLLAKQQYAIVREHFEHPQWTLKDRFSPIYYAFLKLTHDEAFGRMPPELNEPVNHILTTIQTMAQDYA